MAAEVKVQTIKNSHLYDMYAYMPWMSIYNEWMSILPAFIPPNFWTIIFAAKFCLSLIWRDIHAVWQGDHFFARFLFWQRLLLFRHLIVIWNNYRALYNFITAMVIFLLLFWQTIIDIHMNIQMPPKDNKNWSFVFSFYSIGIIGQQQIEFWHDIYFR